MIKLRTLISLGVIMVTWSVLAQEYSIEKISIEEGLSQSTINAIVQDQKGFLWLGTQDGLNRYDGRNFKVFKRNPFDTTSLSNNFVTALLIDSSERLWVGTRNGGLHLFDAKTEQFRRYEHDPQQATTLSSNYITTIYEDSQKQLWIGTVNGLNRALFSAEDSTALSFARYRYRDNFKDQRIAGDQFIRSILFTADQRLWVGTRKGLWCYRLDSLGQLIALNTDKPLLDFSRSVNVLRQVDTEKIWAGTSRGIFSIESSFRPDTDTLAVKVDNFLPQNTITDILWTKDGNFLVSTDNGLFCKKLDTMDRVTDFEPFTINSSEQLVVREISQVFEDRIFNGLYWVGTQLSGLVKMVEKRAKFNTLRLDASYPYRNQLSPSVRYVFEDSTEMIWIGLREGMLQYALPTGEYKLVERIRIDQTRKLLPTSLISKVTADRDGTIWASTYLGLYRLSRDAQGTLLAHRISSPSYCTDRAAFSFFETEEGYYFGTSLGLNFMDRITRKVESCPTMLDSLQARNTDYRVHAFLKDRQQNLWIGSTKGLLVFRNIEGSFWTQRDRQPNIFYHNKNDKNSLIDDYIHQIIEDREGNIWLGTRLGLVEATLTEEGIGLTTYREQEGLANDVVYSILEDTLRAQLWLSTNNGLSRFDLKSRRFENFRMKDGLQSNEFNEFAAHQGVSGNLYFGGVNGLTYFRPDDIKSQQSYCPLWISELTIGGKEEVNLLEMDREKPIELDYDQNSFSIKFVCLDYNSPNALSYEYDLEGGAIKNARIGNSRQINFPKLEPGEYNLCVRTVGTEEEPALNSDSIAIIIRSPFWKKSWFYAFLGLITIGIIWGVYHLLYRLKMKRIEEIEKVRINAAQDFHDELGSKLSVISMYSELTREQLKNEDKNTSVLLEKVVKTSNSLYDSMKDMLWALNPEQDKLKDLFFQLKDFGEELFTDSGILFQSEGIKQPLDYIQLPMHHKRHLLLIFKEAMHNALKHANCKMVTLMVKPGKQDLKVVLKDDGKGFSEKEEYQGEGLRNMQQRAAKINCQLHIQSDGSGTTVSLTCPISKNK